jgi:UDP:flavonoid glycosyltransferase YjiC (YdhE family)
MLNTDEARAQMESGKNNPLRLFLSIREHARPATEKMVAGVTEACRGADVIVAIGGLLFAGLSLHELLGVPLVRAELQPLSLPTGDFPSALAPFPASRSARVNRASYALTMQIFWQVMRPILNGMARPALGLAPWPLRGPMADAERARIPLLLAYSPSVLPRPADWPDHAEVTGYWFLDRPAGYTPPADLEAFLAAGPPPVCVGFGSMGNRDPERTTRIILGALARSGQRGVLLTGWGGLRRTDLPESVFMADNIPHDWLFPRMAAVVHHGGAGTTAAGLRAGVPSVLVPHFTDQPFWAHHVHALGVSPPPIPRRHLTEANLANAIAAAVRDRAMRARAAALGEVIGNEDGARRAVAIIERHARR